MGEAGNWPAAVKVVTEWFPARERALAAGIFNSGAAIGAIIAPPLVTWLVLQFDWQTAFVCVGVTGYVWLIGWWLVYHTPTTVRTETAGKPAPPWRLLRTRFLSVLTLSKVFLDPVWYFYIFWFPQYLKSVHGFDLAQDRHDSLDSVRHRRPRQHCRRLADWPSDPPRLAQLNRTENRIWHFRLADDLGDSGNSCHERVGIGGLDIGGHVWLHGLQQQRAGVSRRTSFQRIWSLRFGDWPAWDPASAACYSVGSADG